MPAADDRPADQRVDGASPGAGLRDLERPTWVVLEIHIAASGAFRRGSGPSCGAQRAIEDPFDLDAHVSRLRSWIGAGSGGRERFAGLAGAER